MLDGNEPQTGQQQEQFGESQLPLQISSGRSGVRDSEESTTAIHLRRGRRAVVGQHQQGLFLHASHDRLIAETGRF